MCSYCRDHICPICKPFIIVVSCTMAQKLFSCLPGLGFRKTLSLRLYQFQNSVATCHKEPIQNKPILLVQIYSKHFGGLTRELSAGLESICSHTASKNLPQKYKMPVSAVLAGLVCTCSESHLCAECTGIVPQCSQGLWGCSSEQAAHYHGTAIFEQFCFSSTTSKYFLFLLASKHSMLTKCIRSATGCSQRPLTKEIQ